MTRVFAAVAAAAAIVLLLMFFLAPAPDERTELPSVDAPGVGLEEDGAVDGAFEVNPPPADPTLDVGETELDVTRDDGVEEDPLEVGVPEGEGMIDGEIDEEPNDPVLPMPDGEEETAEDAADAEDAEDDAPPQH